MRGGRYFDVTTASLSVADIHNQSDYSATTRGFGVELDDKIHIAPTLPMSESGHDSSETRSAIAAGTITITDEAAQKARTGQTIEEVLASLNRDTANAHQGPLAQNPDLQEILDKQAEIVDAAGKAGPAVAKTAGDITDAFSKEYDQALLKKKEALSTLNNEKSTDEERLQAETRLAEANAILDNPELRSEWEKWQEGGIYKTLLHAAGAALVAQIGNGSGLDAAMGAAASQLAAGKVKEFAAGMAAGMSDDPATQKLVANLISNAVSGGIGAAAGGTTGSNAASTMDSNNRQLHPKEIDWIMENADEFAQKYGFSLEEAKQILMRQALILVDSEAEYNYRVLAGELNYNIPFIYNGDALEFLHGAKGNLLQNTSGSFQGFFTAPGGQRDSALYFIDFYDPSKNSEAGKYRDLVIQYAAMTEAEKASRPGIFTSGDLTRALPYGAVMP